ncbi:MAG: PDZ domain-containing protein [Bacteroidales bacterium]|nr:PDZ domain-containing protein [Bacteroidales bacterium]MBQ7671852.1 PDZ domain-containing protein [Paludibacteraceae bacterium]
MMKKYLFPTITIAFLLVGFLIGNSVGSKAKAQQINWARLLAPQSKVDQLLQMMNSNYVDAIDVDSITEEVMEVLVEKLDPHSAYIPKKDLELVNSELSASFSGIGVQFNIQNDTVCIVAVIPGGPSEGVGVLAGDKIVFVDDSVFTGKGMNNEKVMHTLRGPKDTQVKLSIKRNGTPELLTYVITRGDIPIHSVDASFIMKPQIGYIKVNKFSETTYDEFMSALAKLKAEGAKSYIVDLRENSGGYMDQTIKMANEFLNAGQMIVYAEGRAYPRFEAKANGLGRFKDAELVVLINEFSASASEIFAGAMQDNDRALVIGRRSFGKGLVQQQIPFSDGSAVRLTVARYYTPSGRCIQKPYTLGDQTDYEKDLLERFEHGEFYSADSIHYQDTTKYYTAGGRVVYGGGGILPDIFVGRDTTLNTPFYNKCVNMAYTYQFAFQYTDKHRKELKKFTDWQALERHLLKHNILEEFVRFADKKGVNAQDTTLYLFSKLSFEEQVRKSTPLLNRLICAYIIRDVLDENAFYAIFERDDEIILKALEELEKK